MNAQPSSLPIALLFALLWSILVAQTGSATPVSGARLSKEETSTNKTFGFKARVLTAPDKGLIGVWVELSNLSTTTPLKMRSYPDMIPVGLVLNGPDGRTIFGVGGVTPSGERAPSLSPQAEKKPEYVEWSIRPSGSRHYFIPVRRLFKAPPEPDPFGPCYLQVVINAFPSWIPRNKFEHPFAPLGFMILATRNALQLNPENALKEAQSK